MSMTQPQLVADRYRLVEPLGQGGMGRVWRARDEVLHRDVAIKELVPPSGLTDEERREMRERSLREARAIARLNHINVVRIFDVLRTDGDPWIVMEYVPSRSLQDIIANDGPLPATRVAEVGLGMLAALRAAHRAGVVHRDIKPGNVLLADDGRVVLTDWGLATMPGDPTVTRTGLVLGSPAYIAPERARDGTAGPRSDMWSLGATLYAAVEGQSPFARPSALSTLAALATEPPPPARNAGALRPVLNGLLRKDPAERMDPEEVDRLLRRAAGRKPVTRRPFLEGVRRPTALRDPSGLSGAGAVPAPRSPGDASPATGIPAAPTSPGAAPPAPPTQPADTRADQPGSTGSATSASTAPVIPGNPTPQTEPAGPTGPTGPTGPPGPTGSTGSTTPTRPVSPSGPTPQTRPTSPTRPLPPAAPASPAGPAAQVSPAGWFDEGRPKRYQDQRPDDWSAQPTTTIRPAPHKTDRRTRSLAVIASALAAAVLVMAVLVLLLRDDDGDDSNRGGNAGPTTAATTTTNAAPPTTAGPTPSAAPSATGFVLPAGWRMRDDGTGFLVPVPAGWALSRDDDGRPQWSEPNGSRFLLIDQTRQPKADPRRDWLNNEAARRGGYDDYHRIQIEAVNYWDKAADWEFTYTSRNGTRLHVLNRGFVTRHDQAYSIYWSTPQYQWESSRADLKIILDGFKPARS